MKFIFIRGLKIFFRDKAGVFFSLLGVIIMFCLFVFFLGDSVTRGLDFIDNAEYIINSWLVAGMLTSSAITTSMGAYAVMVSDRENKCIKDFYSSPLKRSSIVAGYMGTGFIISIIMSLVTLIFGEIYIIANGGTIIDIETALCIFGVIILSSFTSSAIVCFIVSFVKTSGTYTTISIILGTLIGFLIGAYISIGNLPDGIQWIIKIFPCSHSAVLFRQLLMKKPISEGFENVPEEVLSEFKTSIGVVFEYGDLQPTPLFHILVLIISGIVFYTLAIVNMSRRR